MASTDSLLTIVAEENVSIEFNDTVASVGDGDVCSLFNTMDAALLSSCQTTVIH